MELNFHQTTHIAIENLESTFPLIIENYQKLGSFFLIVCLL